jgi:sorbitol-specific phosphotransferase system component IIA
MEIFFTTILEIGQVRCSESEEHALVCFDEEANLLLEAVVVHNHMIGF